MPSGASARDGRDGVSFTEDVSLATTGTEGCEEGAGAGEKGSSSPTIRRIICRYGRGCTHQDPAHKERFWHPPAPLVSDEQLRTHYICNECGLALPSLDDLQTHLKRKTAWSNASLVGCRISCLVDYKEWHEAVVTQFHKSGKHFIEFRLIGESRWLVMKKIAFYIVERPSPSLHSGEFKDDEIADSEGLAPVEDEQWIYCEDISLDFAFAQSVLFKTYGSSVQETGHKTKGHICLTDDDKESAKYNRGSLLYGELLPRGANKAFGPKRLAAQDAAVLFDLGMGTGKIALQAFLQFRNLEYVYGIELSAGRYQVAEEAVQRMVALLGPDTFNVQIRPGQSIVVTEVTPPGEEGLGRVLHLERGNMFEITNIELADIVMLETDIPLELHRDLCRMLGRMHEGAKTLTYLDLRKIWTIGSFAFHQLESNKHLSDRFPTSWSVQRGHHFFLWRVAKPSHSDHQRGGAFSLSSEHRHHASDSSDDDDDSSSIGEVPRVDSSRCSPYSRSSRHGGFRLGLGAIVGFFRHGRWGPARQQRKETESSNDKVIPLNADGTRSLPENQRSQAQLDYHSSGVSSSEDPSASATASATASASGVVTASALVTTFDSVVDVSCLEFPPVRPGSSSSSSSTNGAGNATAHRPGSEPSTPRRSMSAPGSMGVSAGGETPTLALHHPGSGLDNVAAAAVASTWSRSPPSTPAAANAAPSVPPSPSSPSSPGHRPVNLSLAMMSPGRWLGFADAGEATDNANSSSVGGTAGAAASGAIGVERVWLGTRHGYHEAPYTPPPAGSQGSPSRGAGVGGGFGGGDSLGGNSNSNSNSNSHSLIGEDASADWDFPVAAGPGGRERHLAGEDDRSPPVHAGGACTIA